MRRAREMLLGRSSVATVASTLGYGSRGRLRSRLLQDHQADAAGCAARRPDVARAALDGPCGAPPRVAEPPADGLRAEVGRLDGKQVTDVVDGSRGPARPPGVLHERRGVDQRVVPTPQHQDGHPHGVERLVRRPLGDEHGVDDRRERRGRAPSRSGCTRASSRPSRPHVDLRVGDPARVSADQAGPVTGDGAPICDRGSLGVQDAPTRKSQQEACAGGPAATASVPTSATRGPRLMTSSATAASGPPGPLARIFSGIIPAASAATSPPVDQPCSTTWPSRRSCCTKADTKPASRSARGPCRYGEPVWPATAPGGRRTSPARAG